MHPLLTCEKLGTQIILTSHCLPLYPLSGLLIVSWCWRIWSPLQIWHMLLQGQGMERHLLPPNQQEPTEVFFSNVLYAHNGNNFKMLQAAPKDAHWLSIFFACSRAEAEGSLRRIFAMIPNHLCGSLLEQPSLLPKVEILWHGGNNTSQESHARLVQDCYKKNHIFWRNRIINLPLFCLWIG